MSERDVEKVAEGLLAHLHLSASQAAVLLDETSGRKTLRVYVYDDRVACKKFVIKRWRGYRVDVVKGTRPEPLM